MNPSRSLFRRAPYLVLIALCLGMTTVPTMSIAQAATPSTQSESKPGVPSEQKQDQKADTSESDSFRHSPTVTWFANLLHVDVETGAKIFEYINFGIILLAVGIPLIKILPKVLRQRSAKLSFEIEVAKAKTADANDRLSAVEAKLAGLDAEISAIRKQVEEDMRQDETRGKALLEEESARIVAAAEQEVVMAGVLAQRGLKAFAADLAIDRALSKLSLDAATDRALMAEFAEDVAGSGGKSKGGRK